MDANPKSERRNKRRIEGPYPAIVRGVSVSGESFEANTTVDNLSAGGIYVRISHCVEKDAMLFVMAQLSLSSNNEMPPPRVAIRGKAVRVEPQADGGCGVAIQIMRHRFL